MAVYNCEDKRVKTSFNNIVEFIELTIRAKELSEKFEGAEEIQKVIDTAVVEMCDDKIIVRVDIVSIFFALEDLLKLPVITSHTLEYYGLINLMFKGLEFDEGFYFK